ncbi:hypothetical protein DFQ28_004112 [Apophysomyces sp. BC1034]|nr:hypothetical protein DFQ30_003198 [Apophysomyces sp. BC1015]KAG0179441.1 hypothetical protein DFQ29_002093 [Apophysomyces sp. BC1021]KAG0188961.1 hypothetical protein DFQ28_004112 [Apophysomyces sp. BC1034]
MTKDRSSYDDYDLLEELGTGSFGSVHKARHKDTQTIVAIKIMKKKFATTDECDSLREIFLMKQLPSHINVVQFYDSFLTPTQDFHFVMEYVDGGNLYQLMKERRRTAKSFEHREMRDILRQILAALAHIHQNNIFHRDMKPENLLIGAGTGVIKLADFGLAREIQSSPPYTEYVSTRWYRAPEVLLRATSYSYPVDLWAVGAIFAELITLTPLFPGQSEIDQLYKICELMGSPGNKLLFARKKSSKPEKRASPGFARRKTLDGTEQRAWTSVPVTRSQSSSSTLSTSDGGGEWREGVKLAHKIGFEFPQLLPKPLETVIPNASPPMLDLIRQFLFFNPTQRLKAEDALRHAFFMESTPLPVPFTNAPEKKSAVKRHIQRMKFQALTPMKTTDNQAVPLDLPTLTASPLQLSKSLPDDFCQTITSHTASQGKKTLHTQDLDDFEGQNDRASNDTDTVESLDMHHSTSYIEDDTDYALPSPDFPNCGPWVNAEETDSWSTSPKHVHPLAPKGVDIQQTTDKNGYGQHTPPATDEPQHARAIPSHKRQYVGVEDEQKHTHRRLGFHLSQNIGAESTAFHLDSVTQYGTYLTTWKHPTPEDLSTSLVTSKPKSTTTTTAPRRESFSNTMFKQICQPHKITGNRAGCISNMMADATCAHTISTAFAHITSPPLLQHQLPPPPLSNKLFPRCTKQQSDETMYDRDQPAAMKTSEEESRRKKSEWMWLKVL